MLNADAEERLNEIVGEVTTPGTHIRTIAGHGDASSEIVRIAEKENVDMIVIATRNGRVAPRGIRLSCREGGTTGQMSGANDSSFSGRAVRSV